MRKRARRETDVRAISMRERAKHERELTMRDRGELSYRAKHERESYKHEGES